MNWPLNQTAYFWRSRPLLFGILTTLSMSLGRPFSFYGSLIQKTFGDELTAQTQGLGWIELQLWGQRAKFYFDRNFDHWAQVLFRGCWPRLYRARHKAGNSMFFFLPRSIPLPPQRRFWLLQNDAWCCVTLRGQAREGQSLEEDLRAPGEPVDEKRPCCWGNSVQMYALSLGSCGEVEKMFLASFWLPG